MIAIHDNPRNRTDLQAWSLDALGNWDGFTDGTTTQTRDEDAANETTQVSSRQRGRIGEVVTGLAVR